MLPTFARIFFESDSRRRVRVVAGFTVVASMSSANESNFWPPAVRKSMAARLRAQSLVMFVNPGRYQATTLMPWAWHCSMIGPTASRR